ncbi:MAG: hypothetical protein ACRD0U_13215, partial [Acidimicrobiales bacterium]
MSENTSPDPPPATVCGCCGKARAESEVVRLGDRGDVALCDGCVDWLRDQRAPRAGNRLCRAVPILATADGERSLHHCESLGFETESWEGGGYGFAFRDDIELHFGQVEGLDPAVNGISCYPFGGCAPDARLRRAPHRRPARW